MPLPIQFALALVTSVTACSLDGPTAPTPDPDAQVRILLIGNSLTYTNVLPEMLQSLADASGVSRTQVASVAVPNFSLEDHWHAGQARTAIRKGGWTFVVLQQGPSALETSRTHLLLWAGIFAEEIRLHGGQPALFMVWPSADRSFDFERVSESYRLAAELTGGVLLPAGDAWLAAWQRDASLPLYGADGFHPSPMGTYLAAITIFGGLFDRSPVGLPARAGTAILTGATAMLLQQAADEALGR